jgi:hypothetical protein
MFIRGNPILLVYANDCIAICPENQPIMNYIESIQGDYVLTYEGNIPAYLGIQIKKVQENARWTRISSDPTCPAVGSVIKTVPNEDE